MLCIAAGRVRIPGVSFIHKHRLPEGLHADESIARVVPNLAVEVISQGNSKREMDEKLAEYSDCGVQRVWYVYSQDMTIHVYNSATDHPIDNTLLDSGVRRPSQVPTRDSV